MAGYPTMNLKNNKNKNYKKFKGSFAIVAKLPFFFLIQTALRSW